MIPFAFLKSFFVPVWRMDEKEELGRSERDMMVA